MPWWGYLYLITYWLLTFGGIYDDMQRPHKIIFITGEILTAFFSTAFVTAYFYSSFAENIGLFIFIMLVLGFVYELVAAQRDINDNKNDSVFNEKELSYLNNTGLVLGHLLIVPAYVFGLMAGIQHAKL